MSRNCFIRLPLFHLKLSPCSPISVKHFIAPSRSLSFFKVKQEMTYDITPVRTSWITSIEADGRSASTNTEKEKLNFVKKTRQSKLV